MPSFALLFKHESAASVTLEYVWQYEKNSDAESCATDHGNPLLTGVVVKSQKDLEDKLTMPQMMAVYNKAATEPDSKARAVTKFESKERGASRTWPVVDYLARPGAPRVKPTTTTITNNNSEGEVTNMAATATRTKKEAKAKKSKASAAKEPSARKSKHSGKVIEKLADKNPRREGTHGYVNWSLYRNGMTYEDYVAKGGALNHLNWDLEHKFISLKRATD